MDGLGGRRDVVQLASAAEFRLGRLQVRPATCEVVSPEGRTILQPRVMQVLVVLAEARDRIVSRDELIARCWSGRAVSEGALNRVIVQLRKLSESGGGAFRLETVPRVGYGLTDLSTQLTTVAEPEPHVLREAVVPRPAFARRSLLVGGAGVAGAAALGGAAFWAWSPPRRTRIAVLPFAAEGEDLRAPAASIRDDLVTSLLAIRDLEVVARASSRALHDDPEIQAERDLGATHVLDGSLQRRGQSVRINVSLTDVKRKSVVWSDHYDAADGDLFALQARVAKDVQGVLRMALIQGRIDQPRIDPAAYRLYAEGRLLLEEGDPAGAVAKLKAAVERGPNFSRAWSQLGSAYVAQQGSVDQAAYTPIPRGLAREAARRALALDDRNADAWSTLADATDRAGAWTKIETLHRNALACEPSNIQTLYGAALFYADVGWNDLAIDLLRRTAALDPVSPSPTFLMLRVLDTGGHEAEIDAQMARALPRWSGNRSLWRFATRRAIWLRREAEAERLIAAPPRGAAPDAAYFSDLLACRRDPASPRLATFTGPAYSGPLPETWPIFIFALGMLGRTDACVAFIRRIFSTPAGREQAPTWVVHQQMVRSAWGRPELNAVFADLGLSAYWAARGRGPDRPKA